MTAKRKKAAAMCDCEEALAYWPRLVRARKRHQCRECPASIAPGEVHEVACFGQLFDHLAEACSQRS